MGALLILMQCLMKGSATGDHDLSSVSKNSSWGSFKYRCCDGSIACCGHWASLFSSAHAK